MSEIHLFNITEPVAREIPASAGGERVGPQSVTEV